MATIKELERYGVISAAVANLLYEGMDEYEKELDAREEKRKAADAIERAKHEEGKVKRDAILLEVIPSELMPYVQFVDPRKNSYEYELHLPGCAPIKFRLGIDNRFQSLSYLAGVDERFFLVPLRYSMQPNHDDEMEYFPEWDWYREDCWYRIGVAIGAAQVIWDKAVEERPAVEQAFAEARQRQLAREAEAALEQEKPTLEERQVKALEQIAYHLQRFNL